MDIRLMREFLILARTENYLEAAELLFVSQPTLSRHIMTLENELGVPLFERTTRYVRLSRYGKMLVPYAQQFLELSGQFNNLLLAEKRERDDALKISTIPAMSMYHITDVLRRFRQRYPECSVLVSPCYNTSVPDKLRMRECELAFIREQRLGAEDELVRLPFTIDELMAVVPADHPIAALDQIPLSALRGEDILTLSQETLVYDIISNACMRVGFEPHVILGDHNVSHLIDCISLGMGVGLLFDKQLNAATSLDLVRAVPVTPACRTHISLAYLKNEELSENARNFLAMYKETLA